MLNPDCCEAIQDSIKILMFFGDLHNRFGISGYSL